MQDVNKNMAIFQLEQSLHGDAESFTNILNEKEDQISKVCVLIIFTCIIVLHCLCARDWLPQQIRPSSYHFNMVSFTYN